MHHDDARVQQHEYALHSHKNAKYSELSQNATRAGESFTNRCSSCLNKQHALVQHQPFFVERAKPNQTDTPRVSRTECDAKNPIVQIHACTMPACTHISTHQFQACICRDTSTSHGNMHLSGSTTLTFSQRKQSTIVKMPATVRSPARPPPLLPVPKIGRWPLEHQRGRR